MLVSEYIDSEECKQRQDERHGDVACDVRPSWEEGNDTHQVVYEYEEKSRVLYFNPEDVGFIVAHNQTELNIILDQLDQYDFSAVRERVNSFYGTYESGKATEAVCDRIIRHLSK